MRCPKCWKPIVVFGQRRLETLEEHVFNPNGEPSLKDAYVCVNVRCAHFVFRSTRHPMWDEMGSAYGSFNTSPALFSWQWKYKNMAEPWRRFLRKIHLEIPVARFRCWVADGFPIPPRKREW